MKNKNTLLIVVVVAVVVFAILRLPQFNRLMQQGQSASVTPTTSEQMKVATNTASLALQNVKVRIPDANGEVQLTDGRAEYKGATAYMLPDYYAEHETSQGTDMFGIYTVNYGGSGEFFYLGIWQNYNGAITPMDVEPLDDRIKMESLEVSFPENSDDLYIVTVKYLTHGANQAMVEEPNVPVVRTYQVKDHLFYTPTTLPTP